MKSNVIVPASAALLAASLTGCAKEAEDVSPSYVSPLQYSHYNCNQIRLEMQRISYRVAEISGEQDDASDRDAVATGVGVVVFWPALFFLASGDHEEELARLKGEYEAVQKAAIEKECDIAEEVREAREREAERKAERENSIAEDNDPKPSFD